MPKLIVRFILVFFWISAIHGQQIELSGNNINIAIDGTNVPNATDGTEYIGTPLGQSTSQTFNIKNTGNQNITIERIRVNSKDFKVVSRIRRISSNSSAAFELIFEPRSLGDQSGVVTIRVKEGKNRVSFYFNVLGRTAVPSGSSEIMISQYYENNEQDYIEIKNYSAAEIRNKKYVLAVYERGDRLDRAPKKSNSMAIDGLSPGEVSVFTDFSLRGDEIVVISTSKGNNCYRDRVELIGEQGSFWGNNRSLSKGACASESAHTVFDPADWIELGIEEVDNALTQQNISIGTHNQGIVNWDGQNWTPSNLPDRTRIVSIDGYFSGTYGNLEACDLIVNDELDYDNGTKNSVVVYRDMSIQGHFDLGDQESLVMFDDSAQVSGEITKIERSTERNSPYDFTYWSSPIRSAAVEEVFLGVNAGRIFYFDQSRTEVSDPTHPDFYKTWVTAKGLMVPGFGYAAEGLSGQTGIHEIVFTGEPNNGSITLDANYHEDQDLNNDFNMMGNPYPSAVDIELFFDANLNVIDPCIYLWTHATPISEASGDFSFDDYATYNYTGGTGVGNGPVPTKNIGSSQGFFVRALAKGTVVFNNSMRLKAANDQFFKSIKGKGKESKGEKDRIWMNLTTDQGGFNQLLIGFMDGATNEFDMGYDALKFDSSNKIGFYSVLDEQKLSIQGLGHFEDSKEVQLGFYTKLDSRLYTISIDKLEGKLRNAEIMLLDHELNIKHNLKESNYVFEKSEKGEWLNRFSLIFTEQKEIQAYHTSNSIPVKMYNRENLFVVESHKPVEALRLFDLQGRMIKELHPKKSSFEFHESRSDKGAILLVQLRFNDQTEVLKKVIK